MGIGIIGDLTAPVFTACLGGGILDVIGGRKIVDHTSRKNEGEL